MRRLAALGLVVLLGCHPRSPDSSLTNRDVAGLLTTVALFGLCLAATSGSRASP